MLVLSRKQGQSLCIGDDIHLTILGVSGNQVRVGIEAPREMEIHREEVYLRIKSDREKNRAGQLQRTPMR